MKALTIHGATFEQVLDRKGPWAVHKTILPKGAKWQKINGYTVSLESEGLAMAYGLTRDAALSLAAEAERICPDGHWQDVADLLRNALGRAWQRADGTERAGA